MLFNRIPSQSLTFALVLHDQVPKRLGYALYTAASEAADDLRGRKVNLGLQISSF